MSMSLDLLRRGSKEVARRIRSADHRRRPALERLEELLLMSTITVTSSNPDGAGSLDQAIRDADGPRVTALERFGFHAQPTILVLTFNGPLDPARAQNIANYTVIGPNPKGAVTVMYRITAAVYNPVNNTVTLTFRQRLNIHRTYVIVVNGMAPNGLTSPSGVLLDGNNTGHPGSNYETSFNRANLAGPTSAAGLGASLRIARASHHGVSAKAVDALLAAGSLQVKRHHHGNP